VENADGLGTSWTEHFVDGGFEAAQDACGADVDDDGDADIVGVAYNSDEIAWWENVDDSGTVWSKHEVDGDFNGPRTVFAADVDGDEDLDVLSAALLGWDIAWWENLDGAGDTWVEHIIDGDFFGAYSVYAADMDEDGDIDVLGSAYYGDDIVWWENTDGSGLNWYEHLIDDTFDGAKEVVAADMDGDGDPDIAGVAWEAGDIAWWDATCYAASGELVSSILDAGAAADWDSLSWTSDEPMGTSIGLQVRSSVDAQTMGSWSENIPAPGNVDDYISDGDRYMQYRVILETDSSCLSPAFTEITIDWSPSAGIDGRQTSGEPSLVTLLPNSPNPFSATTRIDFILRESSEVTLKVFDVLGEEVTTMYSGHLPPDRHSFELDASLLASGVYMYRLEAQGLVETRKMLLLR
jgi:hypothetical protein